MAAPSTRPTTAATSAPMTMASITDMPSWTKRAVAKAPTAANEAWHSEMVPPTPVVSVIDSRITDRHTPAVARPTQ